MRPLIDLNLADPVEVEVGCSAKCFEDARSLPSGSGEGLAQEPLLRSTSCRAMSRTGEAKRNIAFASRFSRIG